MGLVLMGTVCGVLVTSACTNVAGLTGYEFGDASGDDGPDARVGDGEVVREGGACKGTIDAGGAGVDPACVACVENNCCDALSNCSSSVCLAAAKLDKCTGIDNNKCSKLATCLKEKCGQCG